MYGTVATLRVKPGREGELVALAREFEKEIAGLEAEFLYRTDPNIYLMVVAFSNGETYWANAASPEQHARYLRFRELLIADPDWHDGDIVYS
jgi:hypothetical protein